ncbi:hypothetical protein EJ02DRAFT_365530 [Clathrospora elynae]|uniref:Tim44-like domain-containing protein n=1 Tax=Clathrospora elynae TaxID=706981 RepID=A0A6A5T542_9PLEO|nr:hypothetical protein EJ02DRAFT_365530 [Clathrospora elynae]
MSTQLPLRSLRIPALQRQCLFLRPQYLRHASLISSSTTTTTRAFSSTPPRPGSKRKLGQDKAQTKAAAESQVGPSPQVNLQKAQRSADALPDDIGLMQDTIVRAPLKDLPSVFSGGFWGYFWALVKGKGIGVWSRILYKRCITKSGIRSWMPVDMNNNTHIKDRAQKLYEQIYINFAKGDTKPLRQICLSPLLRTLESRIATRGPLKLTWSLAKDAKGQPKYRSVRVVSHRANTLGEDYPDTAYRQAVVRLESVQTLTRSNSAAGGSLHTSGSMGNKGPRSIARLTWAPDAMREKAKMSRVRKVHAKEESDALVTGGFEDNGKPKTVVEYLVLQKRVIQGKEEGWKVWGFTQESTPEVIKEDEEYWQKTLDSQVAGSA